MDVSKTKSSFYRRLYVAYLIDSGLASSVPALTEVTGMPRRTAQDTIAADQGGVGVSLTPAVTELTPSRASSLPQLIGVVNTVQCGSGLARDGSFKDDACQCVECHPR